VHLSKLRRYVHIAQSVKLDKQHRFAFCDIASEEQIFCYTGLPPASNNGSAPAFVLLRLSVK